MAVTAGGIIARWPSVFANDAATIAALDQAIADATLLVSARAFGPRYELALTYKAADLAQGTITAGAASLVGATSYQAGPVKITYGQNGSSGGISFAALYDELLVGLTAWVP